MTKKDYELIAKVINDWIRCSMNKKDKLQATPIKGLIARFCWELKTNDTKFQSDKFTQLIEYRE